MVDLFDAPATHEMSEVERACFMAGRYGNADLLFKILVDDDRSLSGLDRLHIAQLVRGDYAPGRGRTPNELKPSYLTPRTPIQNAVAMVRGAKKGKGRFAPGEQEAAFRNAAEACGVSVDQVASAYRRGR